MRPLALLGPLARNITGVTMAHLHSGPAGTNGPVRVTLYEGEVRAQVRLKDGP